MFFGKDKPRKRRFFALNTSVYLMIILTCILAIGNISQDIFFDLQPPQYIEVTREIMVGIVVTATPDASYPLVSQTPCRLDSLKAALARGGDVHFDCNNVILVDEPLVIRNHVRLIGSSEILTTLTMNRDLSVSSLFIIESGGRLSLENVAIRELAGRAIEVHAGGEFVGINCRFANNGSASNHQFLIHVSGTLNMAQCVIEENQIATGSLMRFESGSIGNIQSTSFRANILSPENYIGEGILLDNNGGTVNIHASYFLDTFGQNATNWVVLGRSGETNLHSSVFRNNQFALTGGIIENQSHSMMLISGVWASNNSVISGSHIINSGNLIIRFMSEFSGSCQNTGILNDLSQVCS